MQSIPVDHRDLMFWWRQRLKNKGPQLGHEIARNLIIRYVEENSQ